MSGTAAPTAGSRWSNIAIYGFGAVLGGLAGGAFVVIVTLALKRMMDFVSSQVTPLLIALPLIGLALTVVVLQVLGQREGGEAHQPGVTRRPVRRSSIWRTFPR